MVAVVLARGELGPALLDQLAHLDAHADLLVRPGLDLVGHALRRGGADPVGASGNTVAGVAEVDGLDAFEPPDDGLGRMAPDGHAIALVIGLYNARHE